MSSEVAATRDQAGYSGTPLARKLGIKEGHRVLLCGAPDGWGIPELPSGVELLAAPAGPPYDVVIAFFHERKAMAAVADRLAEWIGDEGGLWLAWPRRAGGHDSDLSDNVVRELILPTGLVDTKVAAIDRDWSALRFVRRRALRRAKS
jgi:hypothetical protein